VGSVHGQVGGIGGAAHVEKVEGGLARAKVTASPSRGEVGKVFEGPVGPIWAREGGMGRPNGSQEFLFFAGSVEPLVHRNDLGGIQCLDEWMGGFTWAASRVAATAEEEFAAQSRSGALQGSAKRWKAAAEAEEVVALVNDGLPGWGDGLGHLGRALAWRFPGFWFVATVLSIFCGFLSFGWALIASQGWGS
jgi:hypothetical protein